MNNKLKVLFLSTRAPVPPNTGHFQRTYNTLKQISKYSDIYFFGFYDKGINTSTCDEIDNELLKICCEVHIEYLAQEYNIILGAILTGVNLFSLKPYVANKYFKRSMRNAIEKVVNRINIDIAHLDMLPLAEYSTHLKDIPIILTNHNVESLRLKRRAEVETNLIFRYLLNLQAKKLLKYERNVISNTAHCIVVSEEDKNYLKEFNPDCHFYVIPNGVDTSYYKPNDIHKSSDTHILWIGSMADPYNRYGILYFIKEIFDSIISTLPNVLWTVVGKQPPNELIELQKQYPENIRLIGYVDDVRTYYTEADVLVIPLLSGSGTKLKVIEGLGMGMPIVTTPIGAEGINVVSGHDLIVSNTPGEFANSVIGLLKNKNKRIQMGRNARKIALEKYDWNQIGDLLKEAYSDTIGD
jgi:polysaccharide biosynthesis protein PslH